MKALLVLVVLFTGCAGVSTQRQSPEDQWREMWIDIGMRHKLESTDPCGCHSKALEGYAK